VVVEELDFVDHVVRDARFPESLFRLLTLAAEEIDLFPHRQQLVMHEPRMLCRPDQAHVQVTPTHQQILHRGTHPMR